MDLEAVLLTLLVRFDMDRHLGTGHRFGKGGLDAIADGMRVGDAHSAVDHQVKLDEDDVAGGAGLDVMDLQRAIGVGKDGGADRRRFGLGNRPVHQAVDGTRNDLPPFPQGR